MGTIKELALKLCTETKSWRKGKDPKKEKVTFFNLYIKYPLSFQLSLRLLEAVLASRYASCSEMIHDNK